MAADGPTDPGDTSPTERIDAPDSLVAADAIDSTDRATRATGWRRGLTAAFAALALVAAGVVGATLAGGSDDQDRLGVAASSSDSGDGAGSEAGERMKRLKEWAQDKGMLRGHGLGFRHGPMGGLMGGALHGEYVVPDEDGSGYRTVVTQRGEVTAASNTSLTVRSEDGFSTTYRLTDETLVLGGTEGVSSLDEGDQVSVAGVRTGETVRAVHVADLSRLGELRRDHPGGPVPGPSTSSGTSTGTAAATA